jgi:hypothetical protein
MHRPITGEQAARDVAGPGLLPLLQQGTMNMFDLDVGGDEPPHQPRGRTLNAADIVRRMGLATADLKPAPAALSPSPPVAPLVAPPGIPLPPLGPFAQHVVAALRQDFISWGHRPSIDQFNAPLRTS